MARKRSIPSIYVLVNEDGEPLEQWFASAKLARQAIEDDMLEEHCGPLRVMRFAAQEEQK